MGVMEEKNWGRLIKYHRQRQGLKQDDVSVGICTTSYLSRIENGVVIAESNVYEMLFARLGIDMIEEKEQLTAKQTFLEKIYEKLLSNEELKLDEVEMLESFETVVFRQELDLLAGLIYGRYLFSINRFEEARELLAKIDPFVILTQDRVTQLYIGITTYSNIMYLEFHKIIQREEQYKVGNYMKTASNFEHANYLYHLAFAYHRTYSFQQALSYIEFATQAFTHLYKPLFQLKLYSMKGVILNNLHRFKEALAEFEAAEELLSNVETIQSPQQWSSLYNNIAYCYECQGLFKEAISYYEKANKYELDSHSIINWMRASYQRGEIAKLRQLFEIYPLKNFNVLHHQYQWKLLDYASDGERSLLSLKELEEQSFPYFEGQEYYSLILYYAPLWAAFYEELHAYKQASVCYKRALKASEKVRERMGK